MKNMEQIYQKYMPQVYRFLFSLCHDTHLAEELTQETFFQALKTIDDFRGDCKLYVWLCSIAKHLWYKELKKKEREIPTEPERETATERTVTEDSAIQKVEMLELYKILHSFEEPLREVMYLRLNGNFSFKEIAKHLKSCKECRMYYQEMIGDIPNPVSISTEELQEVELLKKIKEKNRRKMAAGLAGGFLTASLFLIFAYSQMHGQVKYKQAKIDYGVQGNQVYCTIETKPGYELYFSGEATGNDLNVKVLSLKKIGGSANNKCEWENMIGTEDDPCRWTIEFQDKTIVIENGVLVEEKENE